MTIQTAICILLIVPIKSPLNNVQKNYKITYSCKRQSYRKGKQDMDSHARYINALHLPCRYFTHY